MARANPYSFLPDQDEDDETARILESFGIASQGGPAADVSVPEADAYPNIEPMTLPEQESEAASFGEGFGLSGDPQIASQVPPHEDSSDWRALAESAPQDGSSDNGSSAFGDGDSGWMLALGLDLLMNRGLGTGQIAGAWAQQSAQNTPYNQKKRDLDLQKTEAEIGALNRRGTLHEVDPEVMELRRQQIELRKQQLGINKDAEERKTEQWKELNTAGTPTAQRAYDLWVKGGGDPSLTDMTATQYAKLSPTVNEYFKNTGAVSDARVQHQARQAGAVATAQIAPNVEEAGQVAAVRQPYELEKIRAGATARIEGERDANSGAIPGLIIEDPGAFRNASGDEVTRRKIQDSASAYRALMTSLDRMEQLRAKYGAELPGEVQGEYEIAKTTAIGSITTLGQTGVLNEGEYQRYSKAIPSISPSLLDVPNLVGMDIKGDQIRGVKRALRGTVDSRLYQWGARYDYDSLPGAQPKQKPTTGRRVPRAISSRQPANAAPRVYTDDDLGDL